MIGCFPLLNLIKKTSLVSATLYYCGCIRARRIYSGKVTVFGKKWLYTGKVVVLGQKWSYSGKVVAFGTKVVVIG